MDSVEEFVAERRLIAEHPQRGAYFCTSVWAGRMQSQMESGGLVRYFWKGLTAVGRMLRGVDSLQALTLAIRFAKSPLQSFVEQGVMLYWPDRKSTSVEHIFGQGF